MFPARGSTIVVFMDLSTLYLIHLLAGRLMAAAAGSRTCKVLNVAEKNDAARELSNVMARGRVQRVSPHCSMQLLPSLIL